MSFESGVFYNVKAKPNSSKSEIVWNSDNGCFDVFLRAIPENNKANVELIKLFKKKFKVNVEIVSGFTSKNKKIKVL